MKLLAKLLGLSGVMMMLAYGADSSDPFGGPPSDPFSPNYAPPEGPAPLPWQFTLQYDCIAVPHGEANRMLREEFPNPAAGAALREKLRSMIGAGKAERVAMNATMSCYAGNFLERVQAPGPWISEVSMLIQDFSPGGVKGRGVLMPSYTKQAMRYELGIRSSFTARPCADGRLIHLEFTWGRTGYAGDLVWGGSPYEITRGVAHTSEAAVRMLLHPDQWQLAALTTPPAQGSDPVMGLLPDKRLLVFVRVVPEPGATAVDSLSAGPIRAGAKPAGLLVEWITMEEQQAADLLTIYGGGKAAGLRAGVQRSIDRKEAQLFDTAWTALDGAALASSTGDERSDTIASSGYRFDSPEDDLDFNLRQVRSDYYVSDGPSSPKNWFKAQAGHQIKLSCYAIAPQNPALNCFFELEWSALAGFREEGNPPARMQGNFASVKHNGSLTVFDGGPVLLGSVPLPTAPVFGNTDPSDKRRVMLTFVTGVE